jgi:hypothetical protein
MHEAFSFPAKLEQLPPQHIIREEQRCDSDKELVVVITKDNLPTLRRTLSTHCQMFSRHMIVLDDSTNSLTKRFVQSHFRGRVGYHGQLEQLQLLEELRLDGLRRFISMLGERGWTLGFCRNYAVFLALVLGFEYILMLDDDILVEDPRMIDESFRLLRRYGVVGAKTIGIPDDSIIGHLARCVGPPQYDYITGQYCGLSLGSIAYPFPNFYNEDLIFYAFQGQGEKFARCGQVRQLERKARRALCLDDTLRFQEEGEIALIGAVEAIETGDTSLLVENRFWSTILSDRIDELRELDMRLRDKHQSRPHIFRTLYEYNHDKKPAQFVSFFQGYLDSINLWRNLFLRVPKKEIIQSTRTV